MSAPVLDATAAPCSQLVADALTDFRSSRECGSTKVSRIGYCLQCGAYRREYDQDASEGQRNAGI